jgi:hypothetical protein
MEIEKFKPERPETLLDEAIAQLEQELGRLPTLEELQGLSYYRVIGRITPQDEAQAIASATPGLRRFLEADA